MPIIVGMFGPVMSASSSPTRAPSDASATARFAETVDLPTPPLLLAMAMRWRTPSTGVPLGRAVLRDFASIVTFASRTPGSASSSSRASRSIVSRTGQAGVVSTMRTLTTSPSISRRLHEAERHDVAMQVGVFDGAERLHDVLFGDGSSVVASMARRSAAP